MLKLTLWPKVRWLRTGSHTGRLAVQVGTLLYWVQIDTAIKAGERKNWGGREGRREGRKGMPGDKLVMAIGGPLRPPGLRPPREEIREREGGGRGRKLEGKVGRRPPCIMSKKTQWTKVSHPCCEPTVSIGWISAIQQPRQPFDNLPTIFPSFHFSPSTLYISLSNLLSRRRAEPQRP